MAANIRLIGENTAKLVQGSYIKAEYEDIINPKPKDDRTADEIISNITEKINAMNS